MALAPRIALRKIGTTILEPATRRCPNNQQQQANYYMKPKRKGTTWRTWSIRAGLTTVGVGGVGVGLLGTNWDGLEDEFVDDSLLDQVKGRARSRISDWVAYLLEPRAQELLLPDLLPAPYQAPYTLCIELEDLLVHSNYSRNHGWRTKKRQGLDIFLESLCRHYELVIFTRKTSSQETVEVIEAIDPKMCVLYKLFRDSSRYNKGVYVKDLSNLNRDLSKVIIIDTKRESVQCQPENALILPQWIGGDDMDLIDLADMLVVIAQDRPKDIRTVIQSYTAIEDPVSAYRMRRQEILDEETRMKMEALQKKKQTGGLLAKKWW